jgi:hypothetical protein
MGSKLKGTKINFNGKMVSIGADMHKRSWHITALADGEIVLTVSLSRPNYDAPEKVLSQFKGNYLLMVYEAGPGGFDLYDRLTADGIECIVTTPSFIPTRTRRFSRSDVPSFSCTFWMIRPVLRPGGSRQVRGWKETQIGMGH